MELSNGLPTRKGERGAARAKLLIFLVFAGVLIYAGYMYLPVAYDAYLFKDLMQHNVDVAVTQGYQPSWVQDQLTMRLSRRSSATNAWK
jgi:hypothetical protein